MRKKALTPVYEAREESSYPCKLMLPKQQISATGLGQSLHTDQSELGATGDQRLLSRPKDREVMLFHLIEPKCTESAVLVRRGRSKQYHMSYNNTKTRFVLLEKIALHQS